MRAHAGKEVVDAAEHVAKIQAARDAIGEAPFLLTARTDALETHGLDEAISRARRYKEAGANVLLVEGPRDRDELRRIGQEVPPASGCQPHRERSTPLCSLEELHEMGFFSIGYVLFRSLCRRSRSGANLCRDSGERHHSGIGR